jgi:hypothetical protein
VPAATPEPLCVWPHPRGYHWRPVALVPPCPPPPPNPCAEVLPAQGPPWSVAPALPCPRPRTRVGEATPAPGALAGRSHLRCRARRSRTLSLELYFCGAIAAWLRLGRCARRSRTPSLEPQLRRDPCAWLRRVAMPAAPNLVGVATPLRGSLALGRSRAVAPNPFASATPRRRHPHPPYAGRLGLGDSLPGEFRGAPARPLRTCRAPVPWSRDCRRRGSGLRGAIAALAGPIASSHRGRATGSP